MVKADSDNSMKAVDVATKSTTVPPRRQLGVKEPIVFKWKLLGTAGDVVLTLFKSTEREDVEAQYERIQREGYYTDLKIVEADAKVSQAKKVRDTLEKQRKQMGSVVEKKGQEEKKPRAKERLSEPKMIRIGRRRKSAKPPKAAKTKKSTRRAPTRAATTAGKKTAQASPKKKTPATAKGTKKAKGVPVKKKKKKASPTTRKRRKR